MYTTAEWLGLDVDRFTECVEEQRYADIVEADIGYAKAREVNAVPTFLREVDDQWTMMVGVKENYIDLMNEFIWRAPKLKHLTYISNQYTVIADMA